MAYQFSQRLPIGGLLSSKRMTPFIFIGLIGLIFYIHLIDNVKKHVNSFTDISSSSYLSPITDDETKEYRKKFNLLMDGSSDEIGKDCTLDYINENKLEQDHPCVIKLIRHMFTVQPASFDLPYNLTRKDNASHNETVKRDNEIMEIFKNKTGGFFVECGALDGALASNTLDMEMNYKWSGLLIEGSPINFKSLLTRKRKSWTFPVCLSLDPYPTKVMFINADAGVGTQSMFHISETDANGNEIKSKFDNANIRKLTKTEVQCFPLYSLLLASNRTTVDYFSLDIEGHEMRILETIPWRRVTIKTLRVETFNGKDQNNKNASQILKEWMEGEPGYLSYKLNLPPFMDGIFIKDYISQI